MRASTKLWRCSVLLAACAYVPGPRRAHPVPAARLARPPRARGAPPPPRIACSLLRSVADRTEAEAAPGAEAAAVVAEAARLLRDGARGDSLVDASSKVLALVSAKNNAASLNAKAFASSVEKHRAHYGPLLTWSSLETRSADVSRDGLRATVRSGLRDSREALIGTAVWTLSLDAARGWLIDAVLVQPEAEAAALRPPAPAAAPPPKKKKKAPEREPVARPNPLAAEGAASFGALTSPRWVAKTVLSALRNIDEPEANHGSGVALSFVSKENPAHKLTPELFRQYIDDESYPYGVLKRWLDMNPEAVTFDDDKRKASHDVTLVDVDGTERLVTIDLSKADDVGPWLIDRFWCEEAY